VNYIEGINERAY